MTAVTSVAQDNQLFYISYTHASRSKALKLRYLTPFFAKEIVQKNFPGQPPEQFLERMIELSLYTEEKLR